MVCRWGIFAEFWFFVPSLYMITIIRCSLDFSAILLFACSPNSNYLFLLLSSLSGWVNCYVLQSHTCCSSQLLWNSWAIRRERERSPFDVRLVRVDVRTHENGFVQFEKVKSLTRQHGELKCLCTCTSFSWSRMRMKWRGRDEESFQAAISGDWGWFRVRIDFKWIAWNSLTEINIFSDLTEMKTYKCKLCHENDKSLSIDRWPVEI